mgnify:CR=1 FL=1
MAASAAAERAAAAEREISDAARQAAESAIARAAQLEAELEAAPVLHEQIVQLLGHVCSRRIMHLARKHELMQLGTQRLVLARKLLLHRLQLRVELRLLLGDLLLRGLVRLDV